MKSESNTAVRKLLIVDDEIEILDIISEVLAPHCDEIITAQNGVDALAALKTDPNICAVLSDIKMPKMDGLELLSRIRAEFNPIPFVVLTAFGDSNSYQQAIRLNATDFLEKPVAFDELQMVMKKALLYGTEILKLNQDLDVLLSNEQIPKEDIDTLRRARRTVRLMRIENSIYIKKQSKT